jgi:hypothetical protein
MPIKTFRGLIASGDQDTIVLHTSDGSTGYRIIKFQGIGVEPGTTVMEHTLKIYKVSQTTINNAVDFSDQTLLAVCYINDNASRQLDLMNAVIFDSEIFNQDIYVTCEDTAGDPVSGMNYYIELEQISLDLSENTVATLKDIRNVTSGL